jgi:recombination protein RecA
VIQPGSAEEALNAIDRMIALKHPDDPSRSLFDVIVLDSVAALTTVAELKGEVGDAVVASRARVLSQFCSKIKTPLMQSTTAILLINQVRAKFGVSFGYGPQYAVPGGHSIKFYSSIIGQMKSQGDTTIDRSTGEIVARTFRFKVKKNQVSSPGRDAEVKVYLDGDTAYCDVFKDLAAIGRQLGVFTKEDGSPIKGACNWFIRKDSTMYKVGKGEAEVVSMLNEDRQLAKEVEGMVRVLVSSMNKAAPVGAMVEFDDDGDPLEPREIAL